MIKFFRTPGTLTERPVVASEEKVQVPREVCARNVVHAMKLLGQPIPDFSTEPRQSHHPFMIDLDLGVEVIANSDWPDIPKAEPDRELFIY